MKNCFNMRYFSTRGIRLMSTRSSDDVFKLLFFTLICFSNLATVIGFCPIPEEPWHIDGAFYEDKISKESDLQEKSFIQLPLPGGQGHFVIVGTMIFVGCINGCTATSEGPFKITCVANATGHAAWDEMFPTCEPNVCWWFGDEKVDFRYGTRRLGFQTQGYPKGTTAQLDCPEGTMTAVTCQSDGKWKATFSCKARDDREITADYGSKNSGLSHISGTKIFITLPIIILVFFMYE